MTIYIFLLLFLGQYIYSKASKFNSACVSWQSPLVWFFCLHSYHAGVHSISATWKKRNYWFFHFILCQLEMERPATSFGHSRSFTAACMGGKLAFSSFPPLQRVRKACRGSFTAAPTGGKTAFSSFPPLREEENWQLQLYRRSHRR